MTKRFLCILLAVIFVFSHCGAFAADEIILAVNGQKLDPPVAPKLVNGVTMVPIRTVFEALGYEVEWSAATKTAVATKGASSIILSVGSPKMIVDTNVVNLTSAPFMENGSTFVPVRAICEAANCQVFWDGEYSTINITTAGYTGNKYDPSKDPAVKKPETTVSPSTTTKPSDTTPPQQTFPTTIDPDPVYFTKNNDAFTTEIISLVNEERARYGYAPLLHDATVGSVAAAHSKEMATYDYMHHYSPYTNTDPFDRLDLANVSYASAAENLAAGFIKPEDVVKSWMNSEKHRDVILNPEFTHVGAGYYFGGSNGTYWTLIVVSR